MRISAHGSGGRDPFRCDHSLGRHCRACPGNPPGRYDPDLEKIRCNGVRIVTCAGHLSADAPYARTARLLSERLGCRYVEMSGHHLSFVSEPAVFAAELREMLREV